MTSTVIDDMLGTVPTDEISFDDVINDTPNVEIFNRFELPPTSTRGVPPKRNDSKFKEKRSWYLVSRESNEGLSQSALTFNASLCYNTVPKTVEEALRDLK